MNKKIAISFFLVLLLSGFLFVALGPFISLYGIKKGIDEENPQALESYIDFPELKENVKTRAQQDLMESMGFDSSQTNNLLARFAMQFADQMIDIAIESVISPQGISLMMAGNDLNDVIVQSRLEKPEEKNLKNFQEVLQDSEFSYVSHQEFTFSFENQDVKLNPEAEPGKTTLVFRRSGFQWKLSDVIFAGQDESGK